MADFRPLHSLHNIDFLADPDRLLVKNLAFPSGSMTFEDSTTAGPITLFSLANAAASGRLDGTGLIEGGVLSINGGDPELFDISDGNGIVIDAHTDGNNVVQTPVIWTNLTGLSVDDLLTENQSFISLDINGVPVQRDRPPTEEEFRDELYLGELGHPIGGPIQFAVSNPHVSFNRDMEILDYLLALGPINAFGNEYGPNGANLFLNKSRGKTAHPGLNYPNRKSTGTTDDDVLSVLTSIYLYRDGSGDFTIAPASTLVDPNSWDDGSGVLATVAVNKWTVQPIFWRAVPGVTVIHFGQVEFNSQQEAIDAHLDPFVQNPALNDGLFTLRAFLIVKSGTTDLSDLADNVFIATGKLGQGGSEGGGGVTSTFVTGPPVSVEDNLPTFLGTSGLEIQDSGITVDNLVHASNAVEVPGRVMTWDNPGSGLFAVSSALEVEDVIQRSSGGPSTVGSLVITTDGVNQFMEGTDLLPADLIHANGSVDFTDVQVAVTPVLAEHVNTRGFVELTRQPSNVLGIGTDATPDTTGQSYIWTQSVHTITDLLGGENGDRVTIVSFSTALTVVHDGADISLRNNKIVVLGVPDTLSLIQRSGQWKEDGRRVDGQDVEADGSVDFTGEVVVITPTVADSAANKGYIDTRQPKGVFGFTTDTTPSVLAANFLRTSSGTVVTNLDDGVTGQLVTVGCTSATELTIVHSSDLRLKGQVNAILTLSETISFVYDGNDWWETGRSGQSSGAFVPHDGVDTTPQIHSQSRIKLGGSTTITDFDDATEGQHLYIVATSSRTVQHGSGINLNGNVDYDMVAGDTLILMFDDTDWLEMGRGGQ